MISSSFIQYGPRLCGTPASLSLGFALFGCAEEPAELAVYTPPPWARSRDASAPPPPAEPAPWARSMDASGPPPSPRPRPACLSDPAPDAGVSPPSIPDEDAGHVANAERVIAPLRKDFRLCYNKELAIDPLEQGCVTIVVRIAPDGTVTSAEPANADGLSPAVGLCLASALQQAHFDAPGANGAMIKVPAKFVKW